MDIREKILEAASRIYSECGFRGTTTRRVAQEAGVNEVTLFRHFGSKEVLIREAVQAGWGRVEIARLPDVPVDPAVELTHWAEGYFEVHVHCAPFIRTRLGEFQANPQILPPSGSPGARAAAEVARYLEKSQQRGLVRADVSAVHAASMFVGSLFANALIREGVPDMYPGSPADEVRDYVRIFLQGMGTTQ